MQNSHDHRRARERDTEVLFVMAGLNAPGFSLDIDAACGLFWAESDHLADVTETDLGALTARPSLHPTRNTVKRFQFRSNGG